jgi:hypothetical protein
MCHPLLLLLQQPGPGQPQPQQAHRHSSSHHARPPRQQQQGSKQRPPPAAGGGSRHASQQQQQQSAAARGPVVLPSIAADNMEDLEQLRRQTPFMCNVKFGNSLPEVRQQFSTGQPSTPDYRLSIRLW